MTLIDISFCTVLDLIVYNYRREKYTDFHRYPTLFKIIIQKQDMYRRYYIKAKDNRRRHPQVEDFISIENIKNIFIIAIYLNSIHFYA